MFSFLERKPKVHETSFSKFIREASSGEKKRVYKDVLKKATDRQIRVIEEASRSHDMLANFPREQKG